MIDSSAVAPPLLLQLVLQLQTKLTDTDVVVATKKALKMKKKKLFRRDSSDEIMCREEASEPRIKFQRSDICYMGTGKE
jgi:hypothetical protein